MIIVQQRSKMMYSIRKEKNATDTHIQTQPMCSIAIIPSMKWLRLADHQSPSRFLPLRRWLISLCGSRRLFRVQGKLESHAVAALAGFSHISALGARGEG